MNSLLHEISTCRHYLLEASAFSIYRSNVLNFLQSGNAVYGENDGDVHSAARFVGGKLDTNTYQLTDFRAYNDWEDDEELNDSDTSDVKYINILKMTGPMTRGGGQCSYGSIEMRDALMAAADTDNVIGHIIYCRTPGGMATTLIDYRKAIDYIRSKGQKIYMFCDGRVASGGTFLSAMCDGVYAFNEEDEIGSIGMYTGFFSLANGAKNAISQETYVEVYADKSTEKNRPYRNGGDEDLIRKETNEYLDELLAAMKADRPSIKEEQMNGALFKMKDVVGSIIDGICTLPELCEMIYKEWEAKETATINNQTKETNPKPKIEMSKEYQNLAILAGYDAEVKMVSDTEGLLTLQPQEADAMESKLGELNSSVETLTAENTQLKEQEASLNESIEALTSERDSAVKELTELKESTESLVAEKVDEARTEMSAQIEILLSEKETLNEAVKKAENDYAEMVASKEALETVLSAAAEENTRAIAEKDQLIADLQAQLEEAQSGIGSKVETGESTANNGMTAGQGVMTSAPSWNSKLSPSENAEAMKAYLEAQKKKVN